MRTRPFRSINCTTILETLWPSAHDIRAGCKLRRFCGFSDGTRSAWDRLPLNTFGSRCDLPDPHGICTSQSLSHLQTAARSFCHGKRAHSDRQSETCSQGLRRYAGLGSQQCVSTVFFVLVPGESRSWQSAETHERTRGLTWRPVANVVCRSTLHSHRATTRPLMISSDPLMISRL